MANLNITELANQGRDSNNNLLPAMQAPGIAVQNLAIGASSVPSAAVNGQTGVLRLSCDIACYYLVGSNPTVTTINGSYLPAGTIEFVPIAQGQSQKIAVIAG